MLSAEYNLPLRIQHALPCKCKYRPKLEVGRRFIIVCNMYARWEFRIQTEVATAQISGTPENSLITSYLISLYISF